MIVEKINTFEKKIETERISIQRKFEKLTKELNVDQFIQEIKSKLDKVIYDQFKESCEVKMKGIDKKAKLNEKSLAQLENFVENLALAVSNMEKKKHEIISNPAATQQQVAPVCLSCGTKKNTLSM